MVVFTVDLVFNSLVCLSAWYFSSFQCFIQLFEKVRANNSKSFLPWVLHCQWWAA